MKTKNSASVLFTIVSFSLGILLGCDLNSGSVKATKPAIEAQPLFTPVPASLTQQKMCDEQAGKKFRENQNIDNIPKSSTEISNYTSHYDPIVNVCYIRVNSSSIGKIPAEADVVYDAFGGRVYANYMWINSQNKKFWEVPPSTCEIHIPGKSDEKCTNNTQFNELTEKYFGVTQ
ncbi:MAG: hypothetical protein ABSC77_15195 [Terracidiphilus sp.]